MVIDREKKKDDIIWHLRLNMRCTSNEAYWEQALKGTAKVKPTDSKRINSFSQRTSKKILVLWENTASLKR